MTISCTFWNSSLGKKQLMAISGLAWCGFVLMHMAGNLLLLVGADAYNNYGHKIVSNPLVYIAELGLVATLFLHIFSATRVVLDNRSARPEAYAMSPQVKGKASLASRSMALSGTLILVFLVLHLITFKYGPYYATSIGSEEVRDLYKLAGEVFSHPGLVAWYLFSMLVLFFHLKHALFSSLQTLGWVPPAFECRLRCASTAFGAIVALGFITAPILFFLRG